MADLEVDLTGLESLSGRLEGIRQSLRGTRDTVDAVRGDLGSGELADALDRFEEHWRDGRDRLDASAQALGTMLRESVRAYRSADDQLAQAIEAPQQGPTVTVHQAPR
jgi:hypothetical protein